MKCSVVIPTYNRSDLLSLTLAALITQDLSSAEFEVLVVDDGSSDDTRQVVREFADRLNLRYFYMPDEGYRVARARNVGLRAARGSVSVLVDSGVLLSSGCLREHCRLHESTVEPLAVCGYVRGFNEDNEDAEAIRQQIDPAQVDRTLDRLATEGLYPDLREEFYAKYGDDFNNLPAPWLVFWTCNVSAKTETFRHAGLFDEQFKTWGGEDVELAYRMHRDGCRFVLARDASSIHYPHSKSYEHNMRDARTSYLYFAEKYQTPITALVPDHHFWVINDLIRERKLPRCQDCSELEPTPVAPDAAVTLNRTSSSSQKVIVFAPHPDDETIAAGGAICSHREDGDDVYIVFSTDGSESHSAVLGIHTDPSPEELAQIRRNEALAAAETLNVDSRHVLLLHFQDTQLAAQKEPFNNAVRDVLRKHADVDVVYFPDPDRELNADHRITGLAVLQAVRSLGLSPRLLKYVVWDKDLERAFEFQNRLEEPVHIDERESTETIDIRRFHQTKLIAMAKHRTQVEFFSLMQTRPVVPAWLMEKLSRDKSEQFRVHHLV